MEANTHQVKILLHPQNEIFRLSYNEKAYFSFWGLMDGWCYPF